MPEELDPNWEYAQFDTEIVEVLEEQSERHSRHTTPSLAQEYCTTVLYYKLKTNEDEKYQLNLLRECGFHCCKKCKEPFKPKKKKTRFCSFRCSMRYTWSHKRRNQRNKAIVCPCGESFIPKRQSKVYCSRLCSDKLRIKLVNAFVSSLSGIVTITPMCYGCGKTIRKKTQKKYCDKRCQQRAANIKYYNKQKNMKLGIST